MSELLAFVSGGVAATWAWSLIVLAQREQSARKDK